MNPENRDFPPDSLPPRKRKWAAGALSAVFPGLGHMYAENMQRGLFFMLLFIGDIFTLVLVAMEGIVLMIILFALLIPVIYLYALFDSLIMVERANSDRRSPAPSGFGRPLSDNKGQTMLAGLILVCALLWIASDVTGWNQLIHENGSLIAAVFFIVIGLMILIAESRKK